MNGKKLCQALGVDRSQLNGWIERGLPLRRDRRGRPAFDPAAVRAWLIDQGLADDNRSVATRDEVAAYFGVGLRTVAAWMAAGCPGRPGTYDLAAIHAWRDAQRRRDPDQLLQGTTSPALERYREERAKLARLDRLERERQLIPRDEIHVLLAQIAQLIRGAGEILQRNYGPDAQQTLDEALDEAAALIESLKTTPEQP